MTPPGGVYLETPQLDDPVPVETTEVTDDVIMGDETPTRDETSDHIISQYVPRGSQQKPRKSSQHVSLMIIFLIIKLY